MISKSTRRELDKLNEALKHIASERNMCQELLNSCHEDLMEMDLEEQILKMLINNLLDNPS